MLRQAAPVRAQCSTQEGTGTEGVTSTKEVETPRFGNDLPPETIDSMTPDHINNLQMLLEHAGDDAGIDLVQADTFANNVNKAKQYIYELDKLENVKIARGEMKVEDKTFRSNDVLKIFDVAVVGTDMVDEVIALAVERVQILQHAALRDKKEAEEAKKDIEEAVKEAMGDKGEIDTEINK